MEDESFQGVVKMAQAPSSASLALYEKEGWRLESGDTGLQLVQNFKTRSEALSAMARLLAESADNPTAMPNLATTPSDLTELLVIPLNPGGETLPPARTFDDGDAFLFEALNPDTQQQVAGDILKRRHGLSPQTVFGEFLVNDFQHQRVRLMEQAVNASEEVTRHLKSWRTLAKSAVPLIILTNAAAFFFLWKMLGLVGQDKINGWELAILIFVLALMAVSPSTLLLVSRPLEGLDTWSPSKLNGEPEPSQEPATGQTPPDPAQPGPSP
ncbi:hypothetical protein LJ756_06515 [Arthrobacter sp. zg-Y411]|uniref:hypothetical protein n=1 Tax=Arthrobacter zhangbolii TaxID=2886936 RepID=UPI001D1500B8|nr:hypothetical protein [Arthrobacter zhangbolii]MCC3294273.1 hypothetical protein [Arthrobacter zhangbolii]